MRTSLRPARTASSTTYWIAGLSTTGSISFGVALVAGRKRVPSPGAGITAFVTGALMSATLMRGEGGREPPAVAAVILCRVQRLVSGPHERGRAVAVLRVDGDADRDRHDEITGSAVQGPRPDPLADALGEMLRTFLAGLRQHDDELLAAVAGHLVDLANLFPDPVRDLDEHCVAHQVPMRVVDLLEAVEVQHQQRQRPAEARSTVDLACQRLLEEAVVAEPGQPVGDGEPLRLLVQEDVVDRHGRLPGEALNGLEVRVVERLPVDAVVEVQDTEDAGTGPQRDADQLLGLRLVRGQPHRQLVDPAAKGFAG